MGLGFDVLEEVLTAVRYGSCAASAWLANASMVTNSCLSTEESTGRNRCKAALGTKARHPAAAVTIKSSPRVPPAHAALSKQSVGQRLPQ